MSVKVRLGLCSIVRYLYGTDIERTLGREKELPPPPRPPRPTTPAPNWICHMTTALARRLRNKTESTNKSLTMYLCGSTPALKTNTIV